MRIEHITHLSFRGPPRNLARSLGRPADWSVVNPMQIDHYAVTYHYTLLSAVCDIVGYGWLALLYARAEALRQFVSFDRIEEWR